MTRFVPFAKILAAAAGIFCALLLTGCWDDAEINGRAFVLGFGMDTSREEETYAFTFQLAIPISGESDSAGSISYTLRTLTAGTPGEAIRSLEKDLGRQVNFEQLNLILIGEGLSESGFLPLTDYFFNRASVRRQSCVAVCEGSAENFFSSRSGKRPISTVAAISLQSFGEEGGGRSISMNFHSLFRTVSNGVPFLLPRLSTVGENEDFLRIAGGTVFGGKGNLLGTVTPDELEIIRLLYGCRQSGTLILGTDKGICCRIGDASCGIKCVMTGDLPAFDITLELVLIPDSVGDPADMSREMEQAAKDELKQRLASLAEKFREEIGVSMPCVQDTLRQRRPDWYDLHKDEAEEICRKSPVRFKVKCRIVGGGIVK